MRLTSLKALAAIPLFAAACQSSTPTDELAGETDEDAALDGKADASTDGVYTYFEIRSDQRKCVSPVCGGYFFRRLNRTTTVCHDGSTAASCYVPELDWTEANLTDELQQTLLDAATTGAFADGTLAIVRGRFAPKTFTGYGNMGRFVVTEGWVAENDAVSDGVFVKAKDNGIRCIKAPCPSITEKALNTSRSANIADIDWSAGGFDDTQIGDLTNDIFGGAGTIFAGDRYTATEFGTKAKGRTATAAYRKLVAPAPCYVGGCSGQICSDEEGAISTCIWKPEYACYQSATCERQPDGECGWTPTAELNSCLANP